MVAERIKICHGCPHRQQWCNGPCPCTIDGVDIISHARNDSCPKDYYKDIGTVRQFYANERFANLDAAKLVPSAEIREDGIVMDSKQFDLLRRRTFMENAANFVTAMVTAKRVPLEVLEERVLICNRCEFQRGAEKKFCSVSCGCQTTPRESAFIKALTEVEENLPKWGCKHPQRSRGKGWRQ